MPSAKPYSVKKEVLELSKTMNNSEIARLLNIHRQTVRTIKKEYPTLKDLENDKERLITLKDYTKGFKMLTTSEFKKAYSYILAMYLGDGYINKLKRTYKLRISLDNKYPNIIKECFENLEVLFPNNKVSIYGGSCTTGNCSVVVVHSCKLPSAFPQHGPGVKHDRDVSLKDWQLAIVNQYPKQFLRGFIHSDGCRDKNIVNGKSYPRYSLSNKSEDIKDMFKATCDLLDLHYTLASSEKRSVNISRRDDVEFMDSFIGPKT